MYRLALKNIILENTQLVASYVSISTLENRRIYHKLCFIFKLVNGLVDAPDLLSMIYFNIPVRTVRSPYVFFVPYHRRNYALHSPLNSMILLANQYCKNLEFFGVSFNRFKRECRKLLFV